MRILLATDGSSYATATASILKRLHTREPIDLTVLTVSYIPENTSTASVQPWLPEWRRREHDRILAHHEDLQNLLSQVRGTVNMVSSEGNPARSIMRKANEIGADLIIVGVRGHSVLGRLLLGSVSDAVATHAECSVLAVRTPESEEPAEPKLDHITLACDGSAGSMETVTELKRFVWPEPTEVNVLSVVPTFDFYGEEYGVVAHEHDREEQDRVRRLTENIAGSLSKNIAHVDTQIAMGEHVGDTIVRTAQENGSDLIIVGDNGHGLIGELLLGSVTKYVLRHAHCSVWISRHHRTIPIEEKERTSVSEAVKDGPELGFSA